MNNICEIKHSNEEAVLEVKSKMPDSEIIEKTAECFKILGDITRMKILVAISQRELCVCDLSALLRMSQSAISHQLRILRNTNLVRFRREGKSVYYSLADQHVLKLIEMGIEHAKE
jgi:DNA-binding transcriptional ArsR family regulator